VLGGLLENRGRIDAALVEFREAVRLRPDFGKAHLDIGAVLAARHDLAGAAEEFRKAALDPDPEIRRQAQQAISH
jgi:Flp pilus assembly protein TadD